jgi:nucleoside-specific outer membrane channel protein Tsx
MKIKLTFLFTMLHLACFSQIEWAPLGAKWHVSVIESLMPLNEGYILYEVSRDTLIEDKIAKVITKTYFHSNGQDVTTLESEYTYQEDGIVYYLKNGRFYTLYDFNATQGDKWTVYGSGRYREMCDYDSLVPYLSNLCIFWHNIQ